MKKLIVLFFFLTFHLIGPFPKKLLAQNTTRAVIIGISDYQDDKITDLQYSHKDAEAFADFLKSKAGGEVPDANIMMLTNEDASAAQIFRVLDWLIDESKEKDQVIIYFSGHGDVETKTIRQRGYLLAHDTPFNNYRVGAIGLDDLNDILSTLSQNNKSKITLITDACHSGNLAGKSINGTQATATALASQFANEIKIMSCQANEISLEGKQWGGGRGLFSYHFIQGLAGMADHDDNLQVSLKEIGRYLEDQVTEEASPDRQTPMIVGDRNARLSFVDEELLAQLKDQRKTSLDGTMASRKPKSNFLETIDTFHLEMYQAFERALSEKYFLPSDWKTNRVLGQSASELYDNLVQIPALISLQNTMKGNFAAALQDETQQAIISYLNTDPIEMDKRRKDFGAAYLSEPAYLAKAASLLGSDHYLYEKILSKQYYFEGLMFRLAAERDQQVALFDSAFAKVQLALQYDDQAAYIYNEIGLIKWRKDNSSDALLFFDTAMAKTPTWLLPPSNKMVFYMRNRQFEKADSMGQIVLSIDSNYYQAYDVLAQNFDLRKQTSKAKEMYHKALEINPNFLISNNNLGAMYFDEKDYDKARFYFEKSIEIDSSYIRGYKNMSDIYSATFKRDSALLQYEKIIALDSSALIPYVDLAYLQMYADQFQKAKTTLESLHSKFPNHMEYHFGLACWNALQGNSNAAIIELGKAIDKGIKLQRVRDDADLDSIKNSAGYIDLMEK